MTISPTSATIGPGGTQVFTASEAVDWSCSAGSISSGGTFTAPVESPCQFLGNVGATTCTVTAVTKGSKSVLLSAFFNFGALITFGAGNAVQVTVALTRQQVALTEKFVTVAPGATHQFIGSVTNYKADGSIKWQLSPNDLSYPGPTIAQRALGGGYSAYLGSINSTGLYTAPAVSPGFRVLVYAYSNENRYMYDNCSILIG